MGLRREQLVREHKIYSLFRTKNNENRFNYICNSICLCYSIKFMFQEVYA